MANTIDLGNVRGPQGLTGATGSQGLAGAKGATGDRGLQGVPGPQGPKGDIGLTGPQGAKGATGDRGPQGVQGIQGIQGSKGDMGATGAAGTTTWAGITGKPGTFPPSGHTHPADQVIGNCRSICFARNNAQVNSTNNGEISYNIVPAGRDMDHSLAQLSAGKVRILKTGRYFMNFQNIYVGHSGVTPRGVYETIMVNGVVDTIFVSGGGWSNLCGGSGQKTKNLSAGDMISLHYNVDGGVCDISACLFDFIYLGA